MTQRVDAELTQILPTLPEVTQCAVQQHLRFALRRELGERDACAVEDLAEQVEASDGNLRVLATAIAGDLFHGLGHHATVTEP